MSSIFGLTSSGSNAFDSMIGADKKNNTASGLLSSGSSSLSDLSMINNGSYKKLLNAYYKSQDSSTDKTTDKTEKIHLSTANTDASALSDNLNKLMSLEINEDNREEIKKNINSVIESYNKLIDSGSDVNDTTVLRNMLWMTQDTAANAGILEDLGVSVTSGNKLTLDEAKFDKASLTDISSSVKGFNSFFSKMAQRANSIAGVALASISDKTASAYNKKGSIYSSDNSSKTSVNSLT